MDTFTAASAETFPLGRRQQAAMQRQPAPAQAIPSHAATRNLGRSPAANPFAKKKDKEIDAPSPSRVAVLDPAATAQSARQLFHPEPQTEAQLVSFFLNRANLDSNIRDEFVEF
jgi:hypothetical protein